ncbi:MAG: 30S ribosomal protein S12 methylthiotransferase RimO [Alphaproteobacteria bacterium]
MNFIKKTKIGIISLGCPKALVDSERIMTRLYGLGYEFSMSYEDADLVIVNTCGFLDSAKKESLATIAEAIAENGKVIVTGCLGIYPELVKEQNPKVLAITGPHQYDEVVNAVLEHTGRTKKGLCCDIPAEGLHLTPPHYAYLKISEGCDNNCSYCVIPKIRGSLKSRRIDDVFQEAKNLVASGVKELIVVSQDTGAYGRDINYQTAEIDGKEYKTDVFALCEVLGSLNVWVRLHYIYPYPYIDKIIPYMASGKILPYLDIPFQHASPKVLKQMRRPGIQDKMLESIAKWRQICPELTIRSTFIVGFPEETEEDFEMLLAWLKEAQLDRVGCFAFEAVDDVDASKMLNQIPEKVKQARVKKFMKLQERISKAKLKSKLGTIIDVIVDSVDEDGAVARSFGDSPEIDGYVFVDDGQELSAGDIVKVKIEDYSEHDLFGNLVI